MSDLLLTAGKRTESTLSERFGGRVKLGEGEELQGNARSRVLRFPVQEGPGSAPESVIVKHTNSETFAREASNGAAWRLFNDWASLQFLSQVEAPEPFAPAFYGGDAQVGLYVMEDLKAGTRLDHLLLLQDPQTDRRNSPLAQQSRPTSCLDLQEEYNKEKPNTSSVFALGSNSEAAEDGLMAYARLHGRLHALTAGREAEYLRIRKRLGPVASSDSYYNYEWLSAALYEITGLLDVPVKLGADEELQDLRASLLAPGPFNVFVQSDAAPDNFLFDGTHWRLLDFEGARYTHALLEASYCRMPFPTCWCVYRMPEPLIERMETVYRAELVKGCPEAADDALFYRGLVGACITWALSFHAMMRTLEKMLEQDRLLIALTDRQRFLLYLNSAVQACASFGYLHAVGDTLHACAKQLTQRWPEAANPPYYPAFSSRVRQ
ncbi:phosphotransferase [Ktedonobacter robiniae]|uniref:Aminoglycoside phosphotransferase domain-containing protein n=1 Tax=Ktedonobacter robiniae TaxID=2778365 RepID=A0ABQ3UW42_9CHLR|nr:phosphotransferase [Ktedonobacter robiniae]GHO56880.1 hypothetical protein KSB_53550 [Ktedonobacter robiniae]